MIDPRLELWGKIDQATAKGEYRFRIDISSRQVSEAIEAKKYLDLLNLLVGVTPTLLQTGYGHPDFMEVINRLLMHMSNSRENMRMSSDCPVFLVC